MKGLLADNNAAGHLQILLRTMLDHTWLDVWNYLDLAVVTFEDVGLARDANDRTLWRTCQNEGLVLITINRNARGPDSLEVVIQGNNTDQSLPVVTLANPDRIRLDRDYAAKIAESLLELLFDMEQYVGTGRVYLP